MTPRMGAENQVGHSYSTKQPSNAKQINIPMMSSKFTFENEDNTARVSFGPMKTTRKSENSIKVLNIAIKEIKESPHPQAETDSKLRERRVVSSSKAGTH